MRGTHEAHLECKCVCESVTDVMVTLDFSMFPSNEKLEACGWPALAKGAQRAAGRAVSQDETPEYLVRAHRVRAIRDLPDNFFQDFFRT